MIHELKTDPDVFALSYCGTKMYEIRKNDRDFQISNELILKETTATGDEMANGHPVEYTGRILHRRIDHILEGYGLQPGWVILSVSRV